MQKIVIDTNVIIAGLISNGIPNLILNELFIEDKFQLCISEELLSEYYEVINRPKFSKYADFIFRAESFFVFIESKAVKYSPKITLTLISDDDDNMILELADECEADFIITGNSNDFTFPIYKKTKIINPKEYWENYKP